jgi:hypothetical protein
VREECEREAFAEYDRETAEREAADRAHAAYECAQREEAKRLDAARRAAERDR